MTKIIARIIAKYNGKSLDVLSTDFALSRRASQRDALSEAEADQLIRRSRKLLHLPPPTIHPLLLTLPVDCHPSQLALNVSDQ